ncbi:GNAT family N-acetyltransferase [Aliiroseovarius sp. PTFE2010]|uniref:GNAT family N-acetyltransferase n=1 Tax=Aliiroseovarius sp. PTFE2010 TaxID=3417190 RepID=UPI003CE725F8
MTLDIGQTQDIAACRALRFTVFVDEQNVPPEEEIDDLDDAAIHMIVRRDGKPVGTARMLIQGDTGKIGRVCVLACERGRGTGAALMQACLDRLQDEPDVVRAKLSSQTHAIAFYEALGFSAYGPEYDDAGIPHRDMVREL